MYSPVNHIEVKEHTLYVHLFKEKCNKQRPKLSNVIFCLLKSAKTFRLNHKKTSLISEVFNS
ncbi:hypothetical protein GLIP_3408 [Aliiglaciecola lipolytica E3]|uniref:Uncharacterized protein n=1 Tax=Aliiglaciecola lipolytica E3 TaxID=1127673 RepID=K6YCU9_9ALTE|nr:hypothetical protein GLIP_3408 [Aliiglaciecola lipolytica E3]